MMKNKLLLCAALFGGVALATGFKSSQPKWEYKYELLGNAPETDLKVLNSAGAQGWEIAGTISFGAGASGEVLLKRRL
jgi:hypothetical protein